jgi:hypothetical protein
VAESFGGCLALRCLSCSPDLFERAVLVNPATCFAESYGGLLSLAVGTNLLSIFPEQLYQVSLKVWHSNLHPSFTFQLSRFQVSVM